MRRDGDTLSYQTPEWSPYDAAALARIGAPAGAAQALAGRGLPRNAFEVFVRSPERELQVDELPGSGPAAFLADYTDDANSFWLALGDGSVWMRWGAPDEPAEDTQAINTSVQGLQGVLGAWCDLKASGLDENDEQEYEDAVTTTIIRAVSADPEAFRDEEGWWPNFFVELQYTLPRTVAGETNLSQLVRQDESGEWVLDHPGFEDDDEDG
jgi:hypothetical protein